MQMNKTRIPGCVKLFPRTVSDDKKWILQTYSWDEMSRHDISAIFNYDGELLMRFRNTFRGVYFQNDPKKQKMLIRCVKGSALVLVVDVRPGSKTRLKYQIFEVSEENKVQVYLTAGLAVGFLCLEDNSLLLVKSDKPFDPKYQRRLRWSDEAINVVWPEKYEIDPSRFIISMRDRYADSAWELTRLTPDKAAELDEDDIWQDSEEGLIEAGEKPEDIFTPDVPELRGILASSLGITLSWGGDNYSAGYAVLRRESADADWQEIARLPRGSRNYTDVFALPGVEYLYSVRSFAFGTGKKMVWSECDEKGLSASLRECFKESELPGLISVMPGVNGLKVSWFKVDGAYSYRILRKEEGGGYEPVGEVFNTLDSFVDLSAEPGKTYTYTVQARGCAVSMEERLSAYNEQGLKASRPE